MWPRSTRDACGLSPNSATGSPGSRTAPAGWASGPVTGAAIVSRNSDRLLEALLATAWSGSAFALLNTRWPTRELAYAINDVGSDLLVMDDILAPLLPELRTSCPDLRVVLPIGNLLPPVGAVSAEALVAASNPIDDASGVRRSARGHVLHRRDHRPPQGRDAEPRHLLTSAPGALARGDLMEQDGTALHVAPLFHLAGIWPWVTEMLLGALM